MPVWWQDTHGEGDPVCWHRLSGTGQIRGGAVNSPHAWGMAGSSGLCYRDVPHVPSRCGSSLSCAHGLPTRHQNPYLPLVQIKLLVG